MLRAPRRPLTLAAACLVGLAVTGVLAYLVPVARQGDSATLRGFTDLNRPRVTPLLDNLVALCDPASYALIGLSLAMLAVARGRPRVAGLVVILLVATGWTTARLKPLLASPRPDQAPGAAEIAAASWPSGHATAAMTLVLCAVLVSPVRLRPTVAAFGVLFALAVSYSILALGFHFPSDVFGGFLVAATWTGLGMAALAELERRRPSRVRREQALRPVDELAPLAIAGAAGAVAILITLLRPYQVEQFAVAHTTFVAGAAGIAVLAVLLARSFARGVRTA